MSKAKLIIEDGWVKEEYPPISLLVFTIPQNRKIAKIRSESVSKQMVNAYNEKYKL